LDAVIKIQNHKNTKVKRLFEVFKASFFKLWSAEKEIYMKDIWRMSAGASILKLYIDTAHV